MSMPNAAAPRDGDRADDRPAAQPITATEGKVVIVFQEILGHPSSLDASFFDQGGDSVGAARVLAILRKDPAIKKQGLSLRLSDFITRSSVRALSRWIDGAAGPADGTVS